MRHALIALRGEMGYPSALTAPKWGFYDVLFGGSPFVYKQGFGSYVMENVLFKISYPAEFHAQTAVECAMQLHPEVKGRLDAVERIVIETQEPGVRIIDKTGPLANPADRDHCIQYMVAIPLIHGRLTAADYEDDVAYDPRVDALRARMEVRENPGFTADYYAADKRFIGNAIQVFFKDGSRTARVHVDTPIGHRRRRSEGYPVLVEKFRASLPPVFPDRQRARIEALFNHPKIEVVWDSALEEIEGTEDPRGVTGIVIKNVKTGAREERKLDGVFVAIGHAPATELFRGQVAMKDNGYITVETRHDADERSRRIRRRRRRRRHISAGRHRGWPRLHGRTRGGQVPRREGARLNLGST